MQKSVEWNYFLKCPFGLDRKELWFYHQVRSGTLHTKVVMQKLYNAIGDVTCSLCGKSPETIIHLLVECDYAKAARSKVAEELKDKLKRMKPPDTVKLALWFDDTIFVGGEIQPRNVKRSAEGLLEGLMVKEEDFRGELLEELKLKGRKKREAEKRIKGVVDSTKRARIKALYKVYINSVVKRDETLLITKRC